MATPQVHHVICLGVGTVSFASFVNQHIVKLFIFLSRRSVGGVLFGYLFECCIVLQVEQVLTIARCSLNFVAVVFGKDLHCQLQSAHLPCLRRTAEPQTGRRPEHVARFEACMGSAHEVRTRSFTQLLAPEMIGCLIVASWSVDSKGLRLASRKSLAKSAAVVARCAG